MIVNAPSWFSLIWKIIKPLVNERTRKKVRIVSKSETYKTLLEFIDPANIPKCYGGQLRCVCTVVAGDDSSGTITIQSN